MKQPELIRDYALDKFDREFAQRSASTMKSSNQKPTYAEWEKLQLKLFRVPRSSPIPIMSGDEIRILTKLWSGDPDLSKEEKERLQKERKKLRAQRLRRKVGRPSSKISSAEYAADRVLGLWGTLVNRYFKELQGIAGLPAVYTSRGVHLRQATRKELSKGIVQYMKGRDEEEKLLFFEGMVAGFLISHSSMKFCLEALKVKVPMLNVMKKTQRLCSKGDVMAEILWSQLPTDYKRKFKLAAFSRKEINSFVAYVNQCESIPLPYIDVVAAQKGWKKEYVKRLINAAKKCGKSVDIGKDRNRREFIIVS